MRQGRKNERKSKRRRGATKTGTTGPRGATIEMSGNERHKPGDKVRRRTTKADGRGDIKTLKIKRESMKGRDICNRYREQGKEESSEEAKAESAGGYERRKSRH